MDRPTAVTTGSAVRALQDEWDDASSGLLDVLDLTHGQADWGDDEIHALWNRSDDPADGVSFEFTRISALVRKLAQTATVGPLPTPDRMGKRGTIPGRTQAQCDAVRQRARIVQGIIASSVQADALGFSDWDEIEQAFWTVGRQQVTTERKRWQMAGRVISTTHAVARDKRWAETARERVEKLADGSGSSVQEALRVADRSIARRTTRVAS